MPARTPDELLQQAIDIDAKLDGCTIAEKAAHLGLSRSTYYDRLIKARNRGFKPSNLIGHPKPDISPPEIPSDKMSNYDLIKHMCDQFKRKYSRKKAKKWMPFKVNVEGPVGVCFFGDIHAESSGCNWPKLVYDLDIVARTNFAYGVFLGDALDNWVGRLQRLYAEHGITRDQAIQLVEYLARDSGVEWLLWILGNHDDWNEFYRIIKANCKGICPVEDWRARFKLVFPNGREAKIDAAHNHKGHSQYNPLHGQQKVVLFEEMADIVIGAHLHTFAIQEMQHPANGKHYHLCRAKGYKAIDTYADRLQYDNQTMGESVFAVFEPHHKGDDWVQCYSNIDRGIRALRSARAEWESKRNES